MKGTLRGIYFTKTSIYTVLINDDGVILSDQRGYIMQFPTEKEADEYIKSQNLIAIDVV